jgi:Uma2 family endonuclease
MTASAIPAWPDERADPRILETIDALFEPRRMSFDQYWAFERDSDRRHEFVDGEVYLMVGARDVHEIISGNLFFELRAAVNRQRFQVFGSGMRVQIKTDTIRRSYYPDVFVADRSERADEYFRFAPIVVAEVLSPSTRLYDKGGKFEAYKQTPALSEYVLVEQDLREITVMRRAGSWAAEVYGAGQTFQLASIGAEIAVDAVYADTDFGAEPQR